MCLSVQHVINAPSDWLLVTRALVSVVFFVSKVLIVFGSLLSRFSQFFLVLNVFFVTTVYSSFVLNVSIVRLCRAFLHVLVSPFIGG